MKCKIDGCESPIHALCLCNRHYMRERTMHGKMMSPAQDKPFRSRAMELLAYDSETGVFTWRRRWYQAKEGHVAGCINVHGYCVVSLFGKGRYAHRLAWLFVHGEEAAQTIDHINGARSDNRIENLRPVSWAVNSQNRRKALPSTSTGVLGVHLRSDTGRFSAALTVKGARKYLGCYATADEAYAAYVAAKRSLHEGCTL